MPGLIELQREYALLPDKHSPKANQILTQIQRLLKELNSLERVKGYIEKAGQTMSNPDTLDTKAKGFIEYDPLRHTEGIRVWTLPNDILLRIDFADLRVVVDFVNQKFWTEKREIKKT